MATVNVYEKYLKQRAREILNRYKDLKLNGDFIWAIEVKICIYSFLLNSTSISGTGNSKIWMEIFNKTDSTIINR